VEWEDLRLMDLTKVKLHVIEGQTSGSTAIYLIIKGGKRTLVTVPVLWKKRPDLYKAIQAEKIPVDKGVTLLGARVFRVHPRRLSEKQRAQMAGGGERGKYLAEFVEEGMTGEERRLRAREHSALEFAEWTRKESAVKKERRDERRSRSDYVPPEKDKPPRFEGLGAKDVAKLAGLEPTEIRKFLRVKKIGKRGGRYAFTQPEAEKISRAAKKHYARRAA
jgi:hypothetical protein